MVQIITSEQRRKEALDRRIVEAEKKGRFDHVSELRNGTIPTRRLAESLDLRNLTHVGKGAAKDSHVVEFVGTGDFASAWWERARYEFDAGRDNEPILYNAIYNVVTDSTLPRSVPIYTMGPSGFVFEEIAEGGEVKFAGLQSDNKTITIKHYGVGLEYDENIFIYNEFFRVPLLERQAGTAYNALLNHIHFLPILSYTYGSSNKTDAGDLTFDTGAKLAEKYYRTVEAAAAAAMADTSNPRRGSYALLVSKANLMTMARALRPVDQQGFAEQGDLSGLISTVVAYDGWTGRRGNKPTTYTGVTPGKAYLIDLSYRDMDFQSFFKHELRNVKGEADMSRFILEQEIWDTRFGVFAAPQRAVQEITLP